MVPTLISTTTTTSTTTTSTTIPTHMHTISMIPIVPLIVSGSADKSIKIWNAETGLLLNTINGHNYSVLSVAFSPDNTKIVSGSRVCSIKIWNAETGLLLNTLNGHNYSVLSVAFSKPISTPVGLKILEYIAKSMIK